MEMENKVPARPQDAADEVSLEELLTRLDETIEKLQGGDLPLEEAFAAYAEGTGLLRQCTERIDLIEKKVTVLDGEGNHEDFF